MTLRKSGLYGSPWKSCIELRGAMDTSHKDRVPTFLYVKCLPNKSKSDPSSLIDVPPGHSCNDMYALKGDDNIGNKLNARLVEANELEKAIGQADCSDDEDVGRNDYCSKTRRVAGLVSEFRQGEFARRTLRMPRSVPSLRRWSATALRAWIISWWALEAGTARPSSERSALVRGRATWCCRTISP